MAAKNPKKKAPSQKKAVKNGKVKAKKKIVVKSKSEAKRVKAQAPDIMEVVLDEEDFEGSMDDECDDTEYDGHEDAVMDNLDANDYK